MDLAVGFREEGSEKGCLLGDGRWSRAFDRWMRAGGLFRLRDGFWDGLGHIGAELGDAMEGPV